MVIKKSRLQEELNIITLFSKIISLDSFSPTISFLKGFFKHLPYFSYELLCLKNHLALKVPHQTPHFFIQSLL